MTNETAIIHATNLRLLADWFDEEQEKETNDWATSTEVQCDLHRIANMIIRMGNLTQKIEIMLGVAKKKYSNDKRLQSTLTYLLDFAEGK